MTRIFTVLILIFTLALSAFRSAADTVPVLQAGAKENRLQQLTPDGKWVITIGEGGAVRIWDARTGELSRAWPLDGSSIGWSDRAALSPDGKLLASVHFFSELNPADTSKSQQACELRLHEVIGGRLHAVLKKSPTAIRNLRFSPDGALLAAVTTGVETKDGSFPPNSPSNEVAVWDVASARLLWSAQPTRAKEATQSIGQIEFAPNGSALACLTGKNALSRYASYDEFGQGPVEIELREARTGILQRVLRQTETNEAKDAKAEISGKFSSNDAWLVGDEGLLGRYARQTRWDSVNEEITPDKKAMVRFDDKSNFIELWDLLPTRPKKHLVLEGVSKNVDWLPDGSYMQGWSLKVWVFTIEQYFWGKNGRPDTTREQSWDIRTGQRVAEPSWKAGARSIGLEKVVRETESHGIAVHDLKTGHVAQSEVLQPWRFPLRAVAFSPDGTQVAYGTDGQVALWNLQSGAMQFLPAFGGQRPRFAKQHARCRRAVERANRQAIASTSAAPADCDCAGF